MVDDDGTIAGIVSEYDLIARTGTTVGDVMTRDVVSVPDTAHARSGAGALVTQRLKRVPVVNAESSWSADQSRRPGARAGLSLAVPALRQPGPRAPAAEWLPEVRRRRLVRSRGAAARGSGVPDLRQAARSIRSQKSEVRSQKSEVRSQKSEVRSQKSEVRRVGAQSQRRFADENLAPLENRERVIYGYMDVLCWVLSRTAAQYTAEAGIPATLLDVASSTGSLSSVRSCSMRRTVPRCR